jgi:hypothetical protein
MFIAPSGADQLVRYKVIVSALAVLILGGSFLYVSTLNLRLEHFTEAVGNVLIPSALIALVYEMYLRRSVVGEMRGEVTDILQREFSTIGQLRERGLQYIYPDFPSLDVHQGFRSAQKRIRILANWFPNIIEIEQWVADALRNGCEAVEIALLDPDSLRGHALNRNHDLGFADPDFVSREIRSTLTELDRFFAGEGLAEKVSLRLHESTPTHILFAWDDIVLVGTYLTRVQALQGPFIQLSGKQPSIGALFLSNFDRIFTHASRRATSGGTDT